MASALIHIAVAKEINHVLHKNEKELFLGAIAPDISKQIGETKIKSHFLDGNNNDIPNLTKFLNKYQHNLNKTFILGYYIHLYTDYLWFKYFVPDFEKKDYITLLNGQSIKIPKQEKINYIYNDYTNLNTKLLDEYNLDLSLFYEPVSIPNIKMDEIPVDKLQILVDKMGIIIENSKGHKNYIFNLEQVNQFIHMCTELITNDILEKQKGESS